MPTSDEVAAAIKAFNDYRFKVGGIKTELQQWDGMKLALEAAEKAREEK